MSSINIGQTYDKIAAWWHDYHLNSDYGTAQLEKALTFAPESGDALDVGCGAGGRMIRDLEARNFNVTGIDASAEMIRLAKQNHPHVKLVHTDIRDWDTPETFDFIMAWDSLFHLPLKDQKPVLKKLCGLLRTDGIFMYTFGDADAGEHIDTWREQRFPYSTIGITQNIKTLTDNGLSILHLELDQYPDKHVYIVAIKARR